MEIKYLAGVIYLALYGSEILTVVQRDRDRLEAFEMSCARRIGWIQ